MARKYNPARDPRGQSIAWYNYDEDGYRYFEKDSPSFSRFNQYGNQTLLDDSRNWRTKYYTDGGFGHNIAAGNNMEKDGRLFTGKSRTKLIDDDGWITGEQLGHSHKEYEILDWDAYNRDNIYGSALQKRHGKRKFESVQDILDAEEVMSGTWQPAPPPPPPAPPAPPKEEVFKDVLGNDIDLGKWAPQIPTGKLKEILSGIDPVEEAKKQGTYRDIDLGKWAPQIPSPPTTQKDADIDLGKWAPQIPSPPTTQQQLGYDDFASWMNQYNTANPRPQPQQIGYNDFASWMGQYNAANPQPAAPPPPPQIGYNDFASWMGQYNTANPVAKPKDTFGDFMGYMKQYNMMSGPQQQAPAFGYGVGGTSPGGVAAANPYQSFANYMEQFQAPSNASPVTSSLLNI